jgi:hypothetical protein
VGAEAAASIGTIPAVVRPGGWSIWQLRTTFALALVPAPSTRTGMPSG